jgi:hypothetical protein
MRIDRKSSTPFLLSSQVMWRDMSRGICLLLLGKRAINLILRSNERSDFLCRVI